MILAFATRELTDAVRILRTSETSAVSDINKPEPINSDVFKEFDKLNSFGKFSLAEISAIFGDVFLSTSIPQDAR